MPRCSKCRRSTTADHLIEVDGQLLCIACEGDPCAEKLVFSIEVFDVPDPNKDYRVVVIGNQGGLKLEYETTINEVREFFTEVKAKNQERRGKAKLISLPAPKEREEN
jgi:hypothetical protein